jgi:hypothetical protein
VALSRGGRIGVLVVLVVLAVSKVILDWARWSREGEGQLSGPLVIDLVAIALLIVAATVLVMPHRSRVRRSRKARPGAVAFSARGNADLRRFVPTVIRSSTMRDGVARPQIGFGAILVVVPEGLEVWARWGSIAGVIPWDALASVAARPRREGFLPVVGLELVSAEGTRCTFLTTDAVSGMFLEAEDSVARSVEVLQGRIGCSERASGSL